MKTPGVVVSRGIALAILCAAVGSIDLRAQVASREPGILPDLDLRRRGAPPAGFTGRTPAQVQAAENSLKLLQGRMSTLRLERNQVVPVPHVFIRSSQGFLTGPTAKGQALTDASLESFAPTDTNRKIKAFVNEYRDLLGFGSASLDTARIRREFVTSHNGLRTVIWQQRRDNIPVFGAVLQGHLTRQDELVNVTSDFVTDTANRSPAATLTPRITAAAAVAIAASNVGDSLTASQVTAGAAPEGVEQRQRLQAPGLSDLQAGLVWLPMDETNLRLAWEVILMRSAAGQMYRVVVDAESGEVQVRHALTANILPATYKVYTSDSPSPFSPGHATPLATQPALVARASVTIDALDPTASPAGWIPDGGVETLGNNVDAHTDLDNNNAPDLPRPQATGPERVFDFPLDLTQPPSTYRAAAVVNLFYWCNWMHDRLYALGFTEAAGNFQANNFNRGGLGNDAVLADAQDGSGFNNANFSTPPDGWPGRMQMYVFNFPTPNRDGDFDAEIVLHEYAHGLSNRLVGGGVSLTTLQARGMGEGWSDFYALSLLSEPADDVNGNYAAGAYAARQFYGLVENYYYGIRRYPYSTNMAVNPLTFKDIDPAQANPHAGVPKSPVYGGLPADEVHCQGEVWCLMLWEARAALVTKHGPATGNDLILRLVTDGMKLSPANPNFVEARDAILQADQVNNAGANRAELWRAFAKRGLGSKATSPASYQTAGLVENYELPVDLQPPAAPGNARVSISVQ